MMATSVKEHQGSIDKAIVAVEASTTSCKQATENVKKQISDATVFMESLQAATQTNADIINATVKKLETSLQAEKEHFETVRQSLQSDKQRAPNFC